MLVPLQVLTIFANLFNKFNLTNRMYMKKLTVLIVFLIVFCQFGLQAQTYKLNKEIYNHSEYVKQPTDPNNPAVAGIASFFIPGLGQIISGETGRGLGFLGASVGCGIITGIGYAQFVYSNSIESSSSTVSTDGVPLMLVGIIGGAVVNIWSIVDAVKVAKVNNMYFQDKHGNSVNLNVSPYVDYADYSLSGKNSPVVGLSLTLRF